MQYRFFHSQWGEDKLIRSLVPNLPEFGFYVDVGSGDWRHLSNTLHFDRNGWQGLCIEANAARLTQYGSRRTARLENAAIASGGILTIGDNPDFSTMGDHLRADEVAEQIAVPCYPLEVILTKHDVGQIDLLTIDIEGHEEYAWQSMSPSRLPTVVIIEHETHGRENRKERIAKMVCSAGYKVIAETFSNLIFARN